MTRTEAGASASRTGPGSRSRASDSASGASDPAAADDVRPDASAAGGASPDERHLDALPADERYVDEELPADFWEGGSTAVESGGRAGAGTSESGGRVGAGAPESGEDATTGASEAEAAEALPRPARPAAGPVADGSENHPMIDDPRLETVKALFPGRILHIEPVGDAAAVGATADDAEMEQGDTAVDDSDG